MDLQTRVKNILTNPSQEWPVIAAESSDVGALIRDYAAPLSAIAAICRWIGLSVVGFSAGFFGRYRVGLVGGFANAVVSWVLGLVGLWICAIIIEKLAPTFKSRGDTAQAAKLVAYATTPVWVAGVLGLVPALSVLILVAAIYAIYLFYLGLPVVMHTPGDQVIPYMLVSAVVVIVVVVVVGMVAGALVGLGTFA
jgi:hypothetical protein